MATDSLFDVPGTVTLERLQTGSTKVVLQPQPSDSPNDPLNWSRGRKALNFTLVCFYALMSFVLLDIGTVVWGDMNTLYDISYESLTDSFAANLAGLALGCVMILPFAHRYGRRPVYLVSLAMQFTGAIWNAKVTTAGSLIGVNVYTGVAGAVSEAIVQMTIADIFFVHQRATANAAYLVCVGIGTFLAPALSGYVAASQGWQWIWWWCAIFLGIGLVAVFFACEESKYVISADAHRSPVQSQDEVLATKNDDSQAGTGTIQQLASVNTRSQVDPSIPKKSYRQRMALWTPSDVPMLRHVYQPFIQLATFPAVAYSSLMYGGLLAWFSIILTTASSYLLSPPYNFGSIGIGLFNLAPFIGSLLGTIVGGPMNDWWILWRAKHNGGVYEPEMRLHLSLIGLVTCPLSILLFGLPLAHGLPWIVPAVGAAFYGFTFSVVGDISLTYLIDSYKDITGDMLVAVAFVRNGVSTAITFSLTPWIAATGLYNMFVASACLSVALLLLTIPMIVFGKRARRMTADKYRHYALLQPEHRGF